MKVLNVIIKFFGVKVADMDFPPNMDRDDVREVVDAKIDELNAENIPSDQIDVDYSDGTIDDDAVDYTPDEDWD